jgi:FKBP-type peptidyl-prolyl cis-trans isomerase
MKNLFFLAVLMVMALSACTSKKSLITSEQPINDKSSALVVSDSPILANDVDSVSFLFGANFGYHIREQLKDMPGKPGNLDVMISGFLKAAQGDDIFIGMDIQAAQSYLNNYFQTIQGRLAEDSKIEEDKFLAENGAKSGVVTTESGLQYKVIREGTGAKPTLEDNVTVHYHGTLLTGNVFDSSVVRGEPVEFPLQGVIAGFSEGLQLMPVGSKYTFWIPAELAYGSSNHKFANQLLIFEIELLAIAKEK